MSIDWKQKGRDYVDRIRRTYQMPVADAAKRIRDGYDHNNVRAAHADLLAAVRWTAAQILPLDDGWTQAEHDAWETAALRLLTEGFRERLAEIAVPLPMGQEEPHE